MSKSRVTKSTSKQPVKKQVKNNKESRTISESGSTNQPEMKTSEIRDLIDFISKSGLNEVNIETNELKLQVKREPDQKVFKSTPVPMSVAAPVVSAPASSAPQAQAAPKAEKSSTESAGKKTVEIKS